MGLTTAHRRVDRLADRWQRRLATLCSTHRDLGPAGVAYLLTRRLRIPGFRVEWFVLLDHCREPGPQGPGFRWAGPDDAQRLAAFDRGAEVVGARRERGDRCAIVEMEGRIAAWIWIVPRGTYDEGGLIFHLAPGESWAYDGLVEPALRGRRISPGLKQAVVADLRLSGTRRVLSAVDRLNIASLRAAARSGRRVAEFLQFQVGAVGVVRIAAAGRARWHAYRGHLDLRVPRGI